MNTTDNFKADELKDLKEQWNSLLDVAIEKIPSRLETDVLLSNNQNVRLDGSTDVITENCQDDNEVADCDFDINHLLPSIDELNDHDYGVVKTSAEAVSHFAGFVCFKVKEKFTKCKSCISSLRSDKPSVNDVFTAAVSSGNLIYPSTDLFELIRKIEAIFVDVVCKKGVYPTVLYDILRRISSEAETLNYIGCIQHQLNVTRKVLDLFVLIRGRFLVKAFNKYEDTAEVRTKELRKQSKY